MLGQVRSALLWNPSAGTAGTPEAEEVHQRLLDTPSLNVLDSSSREETLEVVQNEVNSGCELLIVAGGDGTVNACVDALMRADRSATLGILPLGTGNDLARNLFLPLEPAQALPILEHGVVHNIDTVKLETDTEQRWYANMLTGGNSGRYLEQMTSEMKQRWGAFCYLRGVVDVVSDIQSYEMEVRCDDDEPIKIDALNFFAANGGNTGAGLPVSSEASLDDGLIDVVIVKDGQPIEIAELTASYLASDFLRHELVWFRHARKIVIDGTPPLTLTADGEAVGTTPVTVTCSPGALPVLLPGIPQQT